MLCAHLWPASHAKERRIVLSCTRSNSLQFLSHLAHHPLTHLLKCIYSCWWNSFCQLHYIAMPIITPDWSWVVTDSSRVAPYSRDLKPPRLQLCGSGPLFYITLWDIPSSTGNQSSLSCHCIETNNCVQVKQTAGRHLDVIWRWQEKNCHSLIVVHKLHCITKRSCA